MEELPIHQSVLVTEVLQYLRPKTGETYLDATFGGGGHTRAMLEASVPDGRVVGLDRDETTERFTSAIKKDFGARFQFEACSYDQVGRLGTSFDGALLDLGMSSDQLENSGRGFSYQRLDEPLDLRFDASGSQTAAQFLNQSGLNKIETVFRDFAQDRYWRRLAAKVVETRRQRPIRTVGDFVTLVGNSDPKVLSPLFQALRITVNDELEIVKHGLAAISDVLKPGGRLVVISFHSLEDRIVKEFFRANDFEILTKKPIQASDEEVRANPRSRSAKLRAGIKK